MAIHVYHVQIVDLSGATITNFQVQGDDTIRDSLLRDQPQSELCTNVGYTFMYAGDRSTFDTGFFTLYLGHPRFRRQPQDGLMGWIKVFASLQPSRKRPRDDGNDGNGHLPDSASDASGAADGQLPDSASVPSGEVFFVLTPGHLCSSPLHTSILVTPRAQAHTHARATGAREDHRAPALTFAPNAVKDQKGKK